jgi:hypothetical protein
LNLFFEELHATKKKLIVLSLQHLTFAQLFLFACLFCSQLAHSGTFWVAVMVVDF